MIKSNIKGIKYRRKYQIIGLKIGYYRRLRGFTQKTLSALIGKSVSFISQIETNNGKQLKGMSVETLFDIADILDIPVEKLFEE